MKQLDFTQKNVEVLTLEELSQTYKENYPNGMPVGGMYHFVLMNQLVEMLEKAGFSPKVEEIFAANSEVMKEAPRYLGVQELADSSVILRFVVNVDEKDIYSGARVLNHDLLLGFRKLGVECPFPQMDVHLDR